MDFIQALILGIAQGATEFLPVSSSGHLVLLPWWLNWSVPPDLIFTVAAHLGTLCAVLVYFRKEWITVFEGGMILLKTRSLSTPESRLFLYLVIGSIPIGVIGSLFARPLESAFQQPVFAAGFLLVTAALLIFSERHNNPDSHMREMGEMNWGDAFFVGAAQLLAVFPGISRSGSTIAAGLFRGISRIDAARFSFLLGTPAILGAGVLAGLELISANNLVSRLPLLLVGFVSAAVVGYLAIAFLLNHLQHHRLYVFAAYCTAVGLVSLLAALIGR